MSVTSGNADTDAVLTSLAALPTTFNGSLTGAVDINAAFTLASGYLVRARRPPGGSHTLQSYQCRYHLYLAPFCVGERRREREDWKTDCVL